MVLSISVKRIGALLMVVPLGSQKKSFFSPTSKRNRPSSLTDTSEGALFSDRVKVIPLYFTLHDFSLPFPKATIVVAAKNKMKSFLIVRDRKSTRLNSSHQIISY